MVYDLHAAHVNSGATDTEQVAPPSASLTVDKIDGAAPTTIVSFSLQLECINASS